MIAIAEALDVTLNDLIDPTRVRYQPQQRYHSQIASITRDIQRDVELLADVIEAWLKLAGPPTTAKNGL